MKLCIFMAYSLLMCIGMRGLAKLRAFLCFYFCLLKQRRMSCTHAQALELMLLSVTTEMFKENF
jgi:predicted membrane metal-binding protein